MFFAATTGIHVTMTDKLKHDAIKELFNSKPFTSLIAEGTVSVHGNSNGTVFGSRRDGANFEITDYTADRGRVLIEQILFRCTPERPLLDMDITVNGQDFCLSLSGPSVSDGHSWSVVSREVVKQEGRREITARVDL